MRNDVPDRYGIEFRAFDGVQQKAIHRRDLATKDGNRLMIVRGLSKTAEELRHPDHPHNHVYLDGAARGPFYDKKNGKYSLDHHDDCIRQITDSTCVQATNLARARIIGAVGHTILGNDPDADTVFGAWALLNADLLAHDERVFRRMQPLMIVEGNIDSYGFGFEELTGLPAEVIAESRQRINWLIREEHELKRRQRWDTVDFADYTEGALRKLDTYALYRDALDAPVEADIHERTALANGQSLHFVQAPHSGIYEVEYTVLNHKGEKDCACIVFHDGKAKWTVKLSGFVNDMDLVPVTDALNAAEHAAKTAANVTDAGMLNARWGGGGTIIGAPRYPKGNGPLLQKDQIMVIIRDALNAQSA